MMTASERLQKMALDLIGQQSTMALATARDHEAWAAPVYYVYHQGAFYFFSDPRSRHIQEALENNQASATIYPDADTWRGIRGIQMTGKLRPAGAGMRTIRALRAYIAKFPFTSEFFEPGQSMNLDNFAHRFRVKLYYLVPDKIYYLDNQIKFGFREEIELQG